MGKQQVKKLRINSSVIDSKPGIYRCWFKKSCVGTLLKPISGMINMAKLQCCTFQGTEYVALYCGESKDVHQRILWHINQNHTSSVVNSGFLSTLRQTICALLGMNMTNATKDIDAFMDENCLFEWDYTNTEEEAGRIERDELEKNYYPLNIQHNKAVSKETQKKIVSLRKQYKK